MKNPTDDDYTVLCTIGDVMDLRMRAYSQSVYGPFIIVMSMEWESYLQRPYNHPSVDEKLSLYDRIMIIAGIDGIHFSYKLRYFDAYLYTLADAVR